MYCAGLGLAVDPRLGLPLLLRSCCFRGPGSAYLPFEGAAVCPHTGRAFWFECCTYICCRGNLSAEPISAPNQPFKVQRLPTVVT